MQSTDKPSKFSIPWANSGTKNTIPTASQIGITAGKASLTDGFPPLTFTPVAAGGVPPAGADFNGILNQITANDRWTAAGGGFPYDSTFSTAIGGYPIGANVFRTDGAGFWISQQDNNTVDPETDTTGKWLPSGVTGAASVTMTSSNVTLTNLQAGFDVIILSGTLTANLNLVFPTWKKGWTIINNCTGAFTVTAKTASGTGVGVLPSNVAQILGDGTNITSGFGSSFSANGYQKLPSGLIIQFGSIVSLVGGNSTAFPIAFPNGVLRTYACPGFGSFTIGMGSATQTSFICQAYTSSTGASVAGVNIQWYAIGY